VGRVKRSNKGKTAGQAVKKEKKLRQDFTGRLVAFVGKEFWQFWAGGAGSIVSFDAGRKVRIYDPINVMRSIPYC
jgi:hypothetical protein